MTEISRKIEQFPGQTPEQADEAFYESAKASQEHKFVDPHAKDRLADEVTGKLLESRPKNPAVEAESLGTGLKPEHEAALREKPIDFLQSIINNPNAVSGSEATEILQRAMDEESKKLKPAA